MKKNRLESQYEADFELIGLVCTTKEYKLAWYLNEALSITLAKRDDIKIEFFNNSSMLISNFTFETEHKRIELIQNRLVAKGGIQQSYLLPELKQFDFFLKLKDSTDEINAEDIGLRIRQIPVIEYSMRINFANLKSKENLLY